MLSVTVFTRRQDIRPVRTHTRALCVGLLCSSAPLGAQATTRTVTLAEAQRLARASSPELRAAHAAIEAARGAEIHAGALANPTLTFDREQATGSGESASQNILGIAQLVEIGGQRAARRHVARLRRDNAEAQIDAATATLDLQVARAFGAAMTAQRRHELASRAAAAFSRAETITQRRFAAGDVSGYAVRRIRLEVARYLGLRAEAAMARRAASRELRALMNAAVPASDTAQIVLATGDSIAGVDVLALENAAATDSLARLAITRRPESRVAALDAAVATAEGVRVRREGVPSPTLSAGLLSQRQTDVSLQGFVVGVAVPIPLWDSRRGLHVTAAAELTRRQAESELVTRRITREVADAVDGYRAAREQVAALAPRLGVEAAAALRAAEVAYEEGEITLMEWLDAVRAYFEAETTLATLRGELLIRRATLVRAAGVTPTITSDGTQGGAR